MRLPLVDRLIHLKPSGDRALAQRWRAFQLHLSRTAKVLVSNISQAVACENSVFQWRPQSILYAHGYGLVVPGKKQLIPVLPQHETVLANVHEDEGPTMIAVTNSFLNICRL